jgi:peroxiredoxin (alkyl hydroperoxide reductase subunit C)
MSALVGCSAPEIAADAVWGDDSVRPFLLAGSRAHYVVLLFYPLDFTPASASELIAIEQRIGDFIRRGVDVAACSVDSTFTHRAWKQAPRSEGGVGPLSYPLIGRCDARGMSCLRRQGSIGGRTACNLRD